MNTPFRWTLSSTLVPYSGMMSMVSHWRRVDFMLISNSFQTDSDMVMEEHHHHIRSTSLLRPSRFQEQRGRLGLLSE
ncbi:MAG: hypothetical protein JRF25_05100 [Deltaproteobacteria bacterium]|nr:hypothetical protein [Deltaproteobacteria bacterium]